MDLKELTDTPPWEWPEETGDELLDLLQDERAPESDLMTAAGLAGDTVVINDGLANALLDIARSSRSEELRQRVVIALGPVLELADQEGIDYDGDDSDLPISEGTYHNIQESLRKLYLSADVPRDVRRRALEASVRDPKDWHRQAIRTAYESKDETWRLTAVFCMQYISGFPEQILESLNSENPDAAYHAVQAAGRWELQAAFPHVAALVRSKDTDKPLLLAAIDAVASIRPQEASVLLGHLTGSEDEDIAEAAYEAVAMAEGLCDLPPDQL